MNLPMDFKVVKTGSHTARGQDEKNIKQQPTQKKLSPETQIPKPLK